MERHPGKGDTMKKGLYFFLFIALLVGFSCTKELVEPEVEVIGGVTYVHNPETPLNPDKTVTFEQELSIGEEDAEGNILIYQPSRYAVNSSDYIYISDRQEQTIHVFDPDGIHVRSFGAKGQGPGEFQAIGRMAFLPDGRLLIIDWRSLRTNFFDAQGNFLESYPWRNRHYDLIFVSDTTCTMDERVFGEKTQLYVKTFDHSGQELMSYGKFTPYGSHVLRRGDMSFAISLPYDPHSVFAGDPKRHWLYHCLNNKYSIEVYDQNGKLFRIIDRPYNPVPFTDEDARKYHEAFDRNQNKVFAEMARQVELPKVKTITERMVVDDRGNLWVATFGKKEQQDRTLASYDIFDSDGYYQTRIWIDLGPGLFLRGKMYRMATDEEGHRTLIRYKVIWKE